MNQNCNQYRRAQGQAYPRTCMECGLGPCKYNPKPIATESALAAGAADADKQDMQIALMIARGDLGEVMRWGAQQREAGRQQAMDEVEQIEASRPPLPTEQRARIREILLRCGYTVKSGERDLKPYVYAAAQALIADALAQRAAGDDDLPPLTMAVYGTREMLEQERQRRAQLAARAVGGVDVDIAAAAKSLASMVTEWVDSCGAWDWRPGLQNVIERRLARFVGWAATPAAPVGDGAVPRGPIFTAPPAAVPAPDELKRITHERDTLAQGIADAVRKCGIWNGDVPLSGPHLLMMCNDMAEALAMNMKEPADWYPLANRCLTAMRMAVHYGKTGQGRPPQQTCMQEIEELESMLAAPPAAAPAQAVDALPVLPGCLADRLFEAISMARDSAENDGSNGRIRKWEATAADLRAALAAQPAAPAGEPVAWLESEESARGKSIKEVLHGMMHTAVWHFSARPQTGNPVWTLHAPVANAGQWVKLSEQKPMTGQHVWIAILFEYVNAPARYDVREAIFNGHEFNIGADAAREPTHWMNREPTPPAPDKAAPLPQQVAQTEDQPHDYIPRRARKVGGSYQAEGTIVADFITLTTGARRFVFEFDNPAGMLHIFGPEQVEIQP